MLGATGAGAAGLKVLLVLRVLFWWCYRCSRCTGATGVQGAKVLLAVVYRCQLWCQGKGALSIANNLEIYDDGSIRMQIIMRDISLNQWHSIRF